MTTLAAGIWLERHSSHPSNAAQGVAQGMIGAGLYVAAWELGRAWGASLPLDGLRRGGFWSAALHAWFPALERLAEWAAAAEEWLDSVIAYSLASRAFSTRPWAETELLRVLRM